MIESGDNNNANNNNNNNLPRKDGRRPDGLTLIPWQDGRWAICDVTVTDTFAASYLSRSASCAGSAAEAATTRKEEKNSDISKSYLFSLWHSKHFKIFVPEIIGVIIIIIILLIPQTMINNNIRINDL